MPRQALHSFAEPVDLVLFSDASPCAYGYVAYAVQPKYTSCQFLLGRANIATRKDAKTIPKLELQSIRLATRGAVLIKGAFSECQINSIRIYNDSKVALSWIESQRSLPTYESNRVHEIRQHKDISIGWVSTEQNPADCLTRGLQRRTVYQQLLRLGSALLKEGSSALACDNSYERSTGGT